MDILLRRDINLLELLEKKSHFLFGPRSTGKTSLIQAQLTSVATILNLLRVPVLTRLSADPGELEGMIDADRRAQENSIVVIDEIQKVPTLLDEVHRLIEERKLRFLLSGSSARRLKAVGVNLLGGRAWIANLFPLTYHEIADFDLDRMLRYGGLPHVYLSSFPERELEAYVETYINEEIKMEGLIRKIPSFFRFLRVAALTNAEQLNFTKLAGDCGISPTTVREYYEILEDTLIGTLLEPWSKSKKRKAVATAKFYFFDTGVCHTLAETKHLDRNSDLFGKSFEHWVFMELRAFLSYRERSEKLRFWRSHDKKEVDFILGDEIAIEVKATRRPSKDDFAGLAALQEEGIVQKFILVSHDPVDSRKGDVLCLNWKSFVGRLWAGEFFSR